MTLPFEHHGVKQIIPYEAMLVILMASTTLKKPPELVIFPTTLPGIGPWICFNLGPRRFGIWAATLKLYEADEHGAMGDDALNPLTMRKEA